jgi:hypothetical protein
MSNPSGHPWDKGLGESQNQCGNCGEERYVALPGQPDPQWCDDDDDDDDDDGVILELDWAPRV